MPFLTSSSRHSPVVLSSTKVVLALVLAFLDPDAAHVLAKLSDGFRMNLTNLRFGQAETSSYLGWVQALVIVHC